MASSKKVFFVKTHSLPSNDNYSSIYLMRDGRDSIISYSHYITSTLPKKDKRLLVSKLRSTILPLIRGRVVKSLITGSKNERNNWTTHITQWTEQTNNKVVIKFEDLIKDPIPQVNRALQNLDISELLPQLEKTSYPSFEDLHRDWPDFFRKGSSGGWREEMSPQHQKLFWKYHGETMSKFGYSED